MTGCLLLPTVVMTPSPSSNLMASLSSDSATTLSFLPLSAYFFCTNSYRLPYGTPCLFTLSLKSSYTPQSDTHGYTYIYLFNNLHDLLDLLSAGATDTCVDNVHVDLSSSWVGSTLLHSGLNESDCLLDVNLLYCVRETHLGNGLTQSDARL